MEQGNNKSKSFFIVIGEKVIARLLDSFKYYNPRYV